MAIFNSYVSLPEGTQKTRRGVLNRVFYSYSTQAIKQQ